MRPRSKLLRRAVDVVTYEFENVEVAAVERLAAIVPVRPGAKALAISQDRLTEKLSLRDLGIATAEFAAVDSVATLEGRASRSAGRRS